MTDAGTKPYLIRAIHEWCSDKGFTPYLAVVVDQGTLVPREYVRNGEIVLNVSLEATNKLQLGNEFIEFQARFSGKARDISIPIGNVSAIYARENGQGMSFDVSTQGEEAEAGSEAVKPSPTPGGNAQGAKRAATKLKSVSGPARDDAGEVAASTEDPTSASQAKPALEPASLAPTPVAEPDASPVTQPLERAPEPVVVTDTAKPDDTDPGKPTGGKPRLTRVK